MKKWILPLIAALPALNAGCLLFSNFQSARLLPKGEHRVVPSSGASFYVNDLGQTTVIVPAGVRVDFAPSSRCGISINEGWYATRGKDDENNPRMNVFNSGGIETKIGLARDKTALSFLLNYHCGGGKYSQSLQMGTKLIRSFYLASGIDITVTPHWGYIFSGYEGPYAGVHLGLGIPLGRGGEIRPEIGVANIDWNNEWYASAGIGIAIPGISSLSKRKGTEQGPL